MTFRIGTDFAKIELTVATLPSLKVHTIPEENGEGEIPPNLANATMLLIDLHKANGDLAWVADMVHDSETTQRSTLDVELFHFMPPSAAEEIMESMKESHGGNIPASLTGLYARLANHAKI